MISGGRRDDRAAVKHSDGHLVVEVVRREQDDLVARVGDDSECVEECHVAAGGDDEGVGGAEVDAVFTGELFDERFPQGRNPVYEFVLVILRVGEEVRDAIDRLFRGRVMDHTLAERDRAWMLANPLADDGDDRSSGRARFALSGTWGSV